MKNLLIIIFLCLFFSISKSWALPICSGSPSSEDKEDTYWDNCIATYTWTNGDKYIGEYKDNKKYGQGTYIFGLGEWNGDQYIGEFKNDKYHGAGIYIHSDGASYVGMYIDGLLNGLGTYTFSDGKVWQGQFKDGNWISGKKYESGEFESSSQLSSLPICPGSPSSQDRGYTYWDNCIGSYTWSNGSKYVGHWKDDRKHGHGITIFGTGEWEGDKYIGEFKEDKKDGQGNYIFSDGEIWQGQFKNDEWIDGNKYASDKSNSSSQESSLANCTNSPSYEGATYWDNCIGTYIWNDGAKYVGEYKNNLHHGHGTYTWPIGDKYIGEFLEGRRHGHGYQYQANGNTYIGEHKNNKRHGQGTYTWSDGRVWQGIWENDELLDGKKYAAGEYNPPINNNNREQAVDSSKMINAASGSGFMVSDTGHIVTNNHVIDGCNEIKVHYNGEHYKASIIAKDNYNDLALLKASIVPKAIFKIKNGNASLLEDIYVAGYPFGDFFNSSVKITKGIVSSLSGFQNNFSNMQIDAALQPGNSGGPVIDNNGNVVGVAVAKLDLTTMIEVFNSVPENTNFAIKSTILLNFLNANGINTKPESEKIMSRSELSKIITDGTMFLSCWMTYAQIEEMKNQKVLFNKLK
tara:strand:- start:122 stop:2014 length:1893 start_codon:yes stop_codon:yes gene_type:complete